MSDTVTSAAALVAKLDAVSDALSALNSKYVDPAGRPGPQQACAGSVPGSCCGSCAAGGPCASSDTRKKCLEMCGGDFPNQVFDPWYQAWVSVGGCALSCRPIDPCLNWYLCSMTSRVDLWAMANFMRLDDDIVSINTNAGAAPFINFPTVPLAANQSMLLRQTSAQRLPWRPGCIRVVAEWNQNGIPRPSSLDITWYTADRDLINIVPADIADQGRFTQVGNTKKLSSYISNDDCCLFPFPSFLRCSPPPIPDLRALYALLALGNVGANDQLVGLNLEIIKAGTDECSRCLGKCKGC